MKRAILRRVCHAMTGLLQLRLHQTLPWVEHSVLLVWVARASTGLRMWFSHKSGTPCTMTPDTESYSAMSHQTPCHRGANRGGPSLRVAPPNRAFAYRFPASVPPILTKPCSPRAVGLAVLR